MSAGAPRHQKGLDPKSREVAADLARRSGLSLSEWVDRLLADDGPEDAISQDYFAQGSGDTAYLETPRHDRGAPSRIEIPEHPADEVGRVAQALDRLSQRIEAAEHRSTLAISGVDQTVRGVLSRLEAAEREQTAVAARFEGAVQDVQAEQARAADRMRRIEADAHGPRSAEALRSLEGALGKVASHLYDGESRTREALSEMRARVDRFESDKGENVVDAVVSRLGQRLEQAEAKTAGALTDLRASFAALDNRLSSVEGGAAPGATGAMEARLETLATNLTSRVEAARAEMAERLRVSADARFDRMDRTLAEMAEHVRAAETRSAQAIEKMGREVIDMAENLGRRVQSVEHRSADAIEQVGGEVARIAQAMETKLSRADTIQAQALEKLGGEIARISERLAERIANSERRSAQAIDDVGEQVARVTERISQRHERTTGELADRIRQSEERTAKLLEEAREKLEKLTVEAQRRAPDLRRNAFDEDEGLFEEEFPSFQPPPPAEGAQAAPAFHQTVASRTVSSQLAYTPAPAMASATPSVVAAPIAAVAKAWAPEHEAAPFSEEDFVAADAYAEPIVEAPAQALADGEVLELEPAAATAVAAEVAEPEASAPVAEDGWTVVADTPEAAAEALEAEPEPEAEPQLELAAEPLAPFDFEEAAPDATPAVAEDLFEEPLLEASNPVAAASPVADAKSALSTREAVERARAAARAAVQPGRASRDAAAPAPGLPGSEDTVFTGAAFGRRPKPRFRAGPVVGLSIAATFVVAAFGGYAALQSEPHGDLSKSLADALDAAKRGLGGKSDAAPSQGNPQLAVALEPKPIDQQGAGMLPAAAAPPANDYAAVYSAAVARIEAKDNSGVAELRRVANLGYAPAQFYLGKLYDAGTGGLKKDPVEARRWTERAAEGGDRKAMHNLGLAYFEGTAGPQNRAIAVQWFQKAAELGVIDSQVNLARIYEGGFGVPQNGAEAYKWYLIAAKLGDAESRSNATRVRDTLSADARTAAERAAAAFRSTAPNASTLPSVQAAAAPAAGPVSAAANDMVTAQRALSALGYYQGPTDGSPSPALRLALSAYQHDQGLPATGAPDTATVSRLSAYVR
ncbi:MAG: SEL1-like repeat protein [Proteobacteria bacterium]|nr:SEL1-like repeat protein [Pseudomonadota bacterium]